VEVADFVDDAKEFILSSGDYDDYQKRLGAGGKGICLILCL
jgi:hypothetical protein